MGGKQPTMQIEMIINRETIELIGNHHAIDLLFVEAGLVTRYLCIRVNPTYQEG